MKSRNSSLIVWLASMALAVISVVNGYADTTGNNSGSASSVSDSAVKDLQQKNIKNEVDLCTGTFTYSIPIQCAPARNGSEPKLSLNYSSGGENGWCGVGWNLDIGYIERYTKDGVPVLWNTGVSPVVPQSEYDDSKGFSFNLFGKQGRLKSIGNNEYRAEVEGDFIRFILNTTLNRWEVYDKSGNLYYFGFSASSTMKKDGWPTDKRGTFRWALDNIVTVTGDTTQIAYTTYDSTKQLYPSTISYNGHTPNNGFNGSLSSTHSITFQVESTARTDRRFSYRSAFRVEQSRRLQKIICKVGTQQVRRYELAYEYSSSTKASRLKQVQVFGSDDVSSLPAQVFTYSDKPMQFQANSVDWTGMNIPEATVIGWKTVAGNKDFPPYTQVSDLVDIDGDALPDRVRMKATSPYDNWVVQRNLGIQANGNGSFAADVNWGPMANQGVTDNPFWAALSGQYTRCADVNGDGRVDRILDYRDYFRGVAGTSYDRFFVEFNTGTGFSAESAWTGIDIQSGYVNNFQAIENGSSVRLIDINGDGIPDRVMTEIYTLAPYDNLLVQLGTGSGFLPTRRFGPFVAQGKTYDSNWGAVDSSVKPQDVSYAIVKFIDINGDGLPDRIMLPTVDRNTGNTQTVPPQNLDKFVVEFGNGYSFEEGNWLGVDPQYYATQPNGLSVQTSLYAQIEAFPYVGLVDVNGDHLPDRVMLKHSDHTKYYVQINTGNGFAPKEDFSNVARSTGSPDDPAYYGISYVNPYPTPGPDVQIGLLDINGDGLVDRVMSDYNSIMYGATFAGFHVNLNAGPFPDLLTTVNNGLGGSVTVQYKPSTTWDNRKNTSDPNSERLLPFVVQTATSVSASDGVNAARTSNYGYSGGFFNGIRQEFEGFACVTNTDPSNRKMIYYFHQGGGRDDAVHGEYQDTVTGAFAKKGFPYRIESYGTDNKLYSATINQVNVADLGNGIYFPFTQLTFDCDYPGGGTPNVTAKKFNYDTSTGNLTKKTLYGRVTGFDPNNVSFTVSDANTADTQYHQISYATIAGNIYVKDHPYKVWLSSDDAGTAVIQESVFTYNANNGTTATTQTRLSSTPEYATESYGYDSYGNRNLITDAVGVQTAVDSFETAYQLYPTTTRIRAVPNSNSSSDHTTATTYEARSGLITDMTDSMGINFHNTYDVFFRLTESDKGTSPGATPSLWTKKISYNLGVINSGSAVSYVDVKVQDGVDVNNGAESRTHLDGFARPIQTRSLAEAGNYRVVSTAYNERGQAFLTTWPIFDSSIGFGKPSGTLAASCTEYDEAGRVKKTYRRVQASFNSSAKGEYDSYTYSGAALGDTGSPLVPKQWAYVNGTDPWWIIYTDEDSKVRRYQLDAFGRTNRIEEVDGTTTYATTLNYDLAGNLTEIINQNAEHIYYGYNNAGLLVDMADPHLGLWKYKRDRAGRVREQTDGRGDVVKLYYVNSSGYQDPLGRLLKKEVYNSGNQLVSTATYTYDVSDDTANYTAYKGLLYKVTDSEGWQKNDYDTRGRLRKATRHLNVNSKDYTTSYTYNDADNVLSTVYPNSGPTINYVYIPGGTLSRVYRTGASSDYYAAPASSFDEFGRVKQFAFGNGVTTTRGYYANSQRLQTISSSAFTRNYRYTAADDVQYLDGTGFSTGETITYDNLHRVKNYSGLSGDYTYDAVGNITYNREGDGGTYPNGSSYTYGATPRKQATTSAYGQTALYDKCGNMIVRHGTTGPQALDYDSENRLARFSQAGSLIVEFGYATDGTRLWKRVNQDASQLQVWIGGIYEEKGGKTLFHVFAGGQRICTFEAGSPLAGGGDPSKVGYYYHQDQLTSSSALSDSTGAQKEINVWYPFGRAQTASLQSSFKVSNRFTGQVSDDETGLYYYVARYYDPELGRFIQADTIIPDFGDPQSYNRYCYVRNNPLRYTDPSGHSWYDYIPGIGPGAAEYAGNQALNAMAVRLGDQRGREWGSYHDAMAQLNPNNMTVGNVSEIAGVAKIAGGTADLYTTAAQEIATAGIATPVVKIAANRMGEAPGLLSRFFSREAKNFTSELQVGQRAARRHLAAAVEGTGGQVHHLIPWEMRENELVKRAAEGGFNINGAENGIRLGEDIHFGSHPNYNAAVENKLNSILQANPNISPNDAAQAVRGYAEQLRAGIQRTESKLK